MLATIPMGWVPLVMVISIPNTEALHYSTNRTTMVATIVLTIVPIEVGLKVEETKRRLLKPIQGRGGGDRLANVSQTAVCLICILNLGSRMWQNFVYYAHHNKFHTVTQKCDCGEFT